MQIQETTQLLRDLHIIPLSPTVVHCGNQAAVANASNPIFHERTKHIEIDCHFVCDNILKDFLKVLPIRSSLQVAYMFTKALSSPALKRLLCKLGILDVHSPNSRRSITYVDIVLLVYSC